MQKKIVRDIMVSYAMEGDVIKIRFLEPFTPFSGEYKILALVRGAGRNGSLGWILENIETNEVIDHLPVVDKYGTPKDALIGTPTCEFIGSIKDSNGQLFDLGFLIRGGFTPAFRGRRF